MAAPTDEQRRALDRALQVLDLLGKADPSAKIDDPDVWGKLAAIVAVTYPPLGPDAVAKLVESAIAVWAVAAGLTPPPTIYDSARKGPIRIAEMNRLHARRAARLVRRGERSGGPSVARELEKQGRTTRRLKG